MLQLYLLRWMNRFASALFRCFVQTGEVGSGRCLASSPSDVYCYQRSMWLDMSLSCSNCTIDACIPVLFYPWLDCSVSTFAPLCQDYNGKSCGATLWPIPNGHGLECRSRRSVEFIEKCLRNVVYVCRTARKVWRNRCFGLRQQEPQLRALQEVRA